MPTRSHNLGMALAILAGLMTFAAATWPIAVPQAHGDLGGVWGVGRWIIAGAFIVAAYLAHRHTGLARGILAVGGILLIANAVLFSSAFRSPDIQLLAVIFEVTPGIVALVAAFLVGPIQRSEAEIEAQHSDTVLPEQPVSLEEQREMRDRRAA